MAAWLQIKTCCLSRPNLGGMFPINGGIRSTTRTEKSVITGHHESSISVAFILKGVKSFIGYWVC